MKPLKVTWCLWVAIFLTQAGCTSQLFIDRTLPAEVSVADDQWKVVVLNRYDANLLPYKREKKVEVYADGAIYAMYGALDAIGEDVTYSLVSTDTAAYTAVGSGTVLSPLQVQEIYRRHPHHLLLTLDHFDAFLEQEVEFVKEENRAVKKMAHYTLITKSSWTLYDSTGSVLDHVTLKREEWYNSRNVISGLLSFGPAISNAGPVINALAAQTGRDYWQRLSPRQVSFVRPYYSDKTFAPAAAKMAAGNWTEAIALLKPLTEHKNRKEAGRAAYNLAVVYEAMGKIEDAKQWANTALDKNNKLALVLLPDLNRY